MTETGYDLAVLMRPSGEARFANVRKLIRLAADFEAAEGRDLRGLLDFLAARADADADAQAATAVEGHDGVRIMTIHSAKGLEFDVVAIPHLSRGLLPFTGSRPAHARPRARAPRIGMQLRRLGARGVNLYAQRELCEEAQAREAQEELRLFHVGATRARERLLLSGVINPSPSSQPTPGTAVDRAPRRRLRDRPRGRLGDRGRGAGAATGTGPGASRPPRSRSGSTGPRRSGRAELTAVRREPDPAAEHGEGPAPLVGRRPATAPTRPLSYTAIAAHGGGEAAPVDSDVALREGIGEAPPAGDGAAARGRAVHALLEWSQANGWREPPADLIERISALGRGRGRARSCRADGLLEPFRAWLGSALFAERVRGERSRAEVPILVRVAGTVLRGSIDLLVERPGSPPLIVDYKTDRLDGADPAELAGRYEIQQAIYALAVAEAVAHPRSRSPTSSSSAPRSRSSSSGRAPRSRPGGRRLEAAIAEVVGT